MDIIRPAQEVVKVVNTDGSVFLEAPAMELDLALVKAQEGCNPSDPTSLELWGDRFAELLMGQFGVVDCSLQDAWFVAHASSAAMQRVKKNLNPLAT